MVIGRFGLKARIATLDDFTADALQGDMGITSPLRPTELPNPDGLTDDCKPGVDVDVDSVNVRADYMRLHRDPAARRGRSGGAALFAQAQCARATCRRCKTRADYPHRRSSPASTRRSTPTSCSTTWATRSPTACADGEAKSRDWRTAPLIGLRFIEDVPPRRPRDAPIEEAILAARRRRAPRRPTRSTLFRALAAADQATLLEFVGSL